MTSDIARERVRAIVGDDLFDAVQQEVFSIAGEQGTWEGDVVPLGTSEGSVAMLTAGEMVVHVEILPYRPSGPDERAVALAQALNAAARGTGKPPQVLHVRDAELRAALEPRLAPRGIEVRAAAMPGLDEALHAVLASMGGPAAPPRVTTPDTWRETGASAAELAAFHEAAAEFYRLAPWHEPNTQMPLLLHLPDGAPWAGSVMGDGGVAFGLALYSEPRDMITLMLSGAHQGMQGYSLTVDFDRRAPLTAAMLRELTAAGWPIAGPRAHPRIFGLSLPEGGVQAEHVRNATLCLRAVSAYARGDDPHDETGVLISFLPLPFGEDEDEDAFEHDFDDDALGWFRPPEEAAPILAEGPGADPSSALRGREDFDAIRAAEEARIPRLEAWLREHVQNVPDAELENARHWCEHLAFMALPAGAVTEYDLRLYIYDLFIRKSKPSERAVNALPASLYPILRFFEEEEGIRYPFAEAVLDELADVEARADGAGMSLHDALAALSYEVYDDLDARVMLHARDPDECVGWPDGMSPEVARLDEELQRHWLLWYDELVRAGTTDFYELEEALLERQRAWEQAPHPAHDGQSPAQVVRAYVESTCAESTA